MDIMGKLIMFATKMQIFACRQFYHISFTLSLMCNANNSSCTVTDPLFWCIVQSSFLPLRTRPATWEGEWYIHSCRYRTFPRFFPLFQKLSLLFFQLRFMSLSRLLLQISLQGLIICEDSNNI